MTTAMIMITATKGTAMLDDFLVRAILAGLAVALAAAPLGCLVVWRRMVYFGDATGHAGLLGIVIGVAAGTSPMLGVVAVAAAIALTVTYATRNGRYSADTVLGVFAHSALAVGLVAASLLPGVRINILEALLGDILAVSPVDLWLLWGGTLVLLAVLALRWRPLLNGTLNHELLVAEGGSDLADRLTLTLGLALFVALAMKIVGVLLITALLLLPAAAARPLARSPETMVAFAGGFGVVAVSAGLALSWYQDTPAGPSIISVAAALFVLSNLAARARTA